MFDLMNETMNAWMPATRQAAEAFTGFFPSIDVQEEDDCYEICVEAPGVAKDDLEVTMSDGVLSISGEKRNRRGSSEQGRQERFFGKFARTIALPKDVDPEGVSADYEDGVLTIRLEKSEQGKDREKRIEIKSTTGPGEGKASARDRRRDRSQGDAGEAESRPL